MSLIEAINRGNIREALAMISRGQGLQERDGFQMKPLHEACGNGHTEVAMALIKRGADCRSVPSRYSSLKSLFERLWNFSPLMCALYENDLGSFRALLEAYDESSDVSSADG